MTDTATAIPPALDDVEAIRQVVAALERAQQTESVDDFVQLFRPDAVWVTGGGRRFGSRDEIEAFTRQVLPGAMVTSTATYEIVHMVMVRADVAVVQVRQRPVTLDRRPLPDEPQGSPTYVMAREDDGRWLIVSGQNTRIIDTDALAEG